MINIYERAVKKMKPEEIDHWQTDLYLKVTPVSQKLVEEYDYKNQVSIFESNLGDGLWYDIPFAYTPEWERRLNYE